MIHVHMLNEFTPSEMLLFNNMESSKVRRWMFVLSWKTTYVMGQGDNKTMHGSGIVLSCVLMTESDVCGSQGHPSCPCAVVPTACFPDPCPPMGSFSIARRWPKQTCHVHTFWGLLNNIYIVGINCYYGSNDPCLLCYLQRFFHNPLPAIWFCKIQKQAYFFILLGLFLSYIQPIRNSYLCVT